MTEQGVTSWPNPARKVVPSHTPLSYEPCLLWLLVVLAVVSRIIWVLWIHPPGEYVFSDMAKYVERAQDLARHGWQPGVRTMAWQAWGAHVLLALPLRLFGVNNFAAAAVWWGLMAATAVPLSYLLALRVAPTMWIARAVGVAVLLWQPNISNAGYFLSETPFLCFGVGATWLLVLAFQTGRHGWSAGCVSAIAFAVRPQSAVFFGLAFMTWLILRRRLPAVRWMTVVQTAVPIAGMLLFSLWRFHAHTGYWGGIAENANMNLTAGRCHNIVTQAFRSESQRARSERQHNTRDGRRVGLPNFRLAARLPSWHPLALRPALGGETIRFVGYIGDPAIHRDIRRRCYKATGWWGQLRMSLTNVALSWFVDLQWPEMEKGHRRYLPVLRAYNDVFVWLVLGPSFLGLVLVLVRITDEPARALVAWQLVSYVGIAAVFFGGIRLRTPYDPYALILAGEGYWAILQVGRRLSRRHVTRPSR